MISRIVIRLTLTAFAVEVATGGKVPLWAANFVQRSAPYAIVVAMQRRLQSGDYDQGKPLPFPVYGSAEYRQTVSR